jgi:hypothetical protein
VRPNEPLHQQVAHQPWVCRSREQLYHKHTLFSY